jgi:ribosome-binding protein aMBF1 (putative translation factor)
MTAEQGRVTPTGTSSGATRRRRAGRSAKYRAEHDRVAPFEVLARMIITRRIRYGLTQEQLAERMGTSVPAISRLESGQHRPNIETLEKVGHAFGEHFVLGFEDSTGSRELATVGH